MELKQVKELMAAMQRAGLKKLEIKEKDGYELKLERQDEYPQQVRVEAPLLPPVYHHPMSAHAPEPRDAQPKKIGPEIENIGGDYVTSPMVGTFYASPSPDDPSFVKVGDVVDENTVVCIIEAMKVMNEVKAGIKGVIAEVLIKSGHPVEFGTKIFRIS